jgi:hypothetical protein
VTRGTDVTDEMEDLLGRLLGRAFLFEDPAAYEAGVRETLELVSASAERPGRRVS